MLFAVLTPFLTGVFAPWIRTVLNDRTGWLLAAAPAGLTIYFLQFLPQISAGEALTFSTQWIPTLGVTLSFYLDGLSLMFALLICGIGTFIVLYAQAYLKGHEDLGRFLMFILLFMGSMLGLVVADNVVTLFVFWELTSITSFLLIGFNHKAAKSRRAALQALVVTGGGGLALLAGLILMAEMGGSYQMSELLASGDVLRDHPWYLGAFILVIAGAFTKSAQVPFHFWLPNAMEAPTPVSAYLHSATMVKAGVYLLARVNPGLGGTEIWQTTLVVFGAATFITGALLALKNYDLKLILAQTTVASLGLMVFLIGLGDEKAIQAAMLYLLAHSLFKGALFMVAGSVDHEAGTRDARALSGLGKAMPITAAAGVLAALSMAGIPPFFGFIAKEFVYKAALDASIAPILLTAIMVAGSVMLMIAGLVTGIKPFVGTPSQTPKAAHEGPIGLWAGAITLAVLSLVFGIVNVWPEVGFIGPATQAVYGAAVEVDLYLYKQLELALLLSGVTVLLGVGGYLIWSKLQAALQSTFDALWGPDKGYDQFTDGLVWTARTVSGWVQSGVLRHYVLVSLLIVAAALAVPVWHYGQFAEPWSPPETDYYVWIIAGMVVLGAMAIAVTRSRLVAILAMGILGLSVAFVFLLFGAPDLAFTQLMVETLSVVILALVITRLPVYGSDWRGAPRAFRDAGIAGVIGALTAGLLMMVSSGPLDLTLSLYFNEKSYTEAFGQNIVNVILVDFRALDTFGEIAVVVITAVAVLGLITSKARRTKQDGPSEAEGSS